MNEVKRTKNGFGRNFSKLMDHYSKDHAFEFETSSSKDD